MSKESEALAANRTWDLVLLPPNKKVIPCKWVYKVKRKANGSIECYKARTIIWGNTQTEEIDFIDTFSLLLS